MKKEEFLAMNLPFDLMMAEINDDGVIVRRSKLCPSRYHDFATHDYYKPYLHPLSDLAKPIEHSGEKFVPIERILGLGKKDGDASSPWNYKILINDNNLIRIELVRSQQTLELNFRDLSLKHAMLLIDWHFDIAGLIEKGEAIDVNTLSENPYK